MTTFTFTQEYIQNQQHRQKIGSVILGSTILFLLIVFYLFNPLKSFDVSVQWLFPIVILLTLLFSIYVYNKNIRLFLSTVIELDENKISATSLDSTRKVILREEIKQIVELKGNGLRIDSINSDLSIYLPTELQNYKQLKTNLSTWSPFVSQSDPLIKLYIFLSVLIVAGIIMIIYPPIFISPIILNGIIFLTMLSILIRFIKRNSRHAS